MQPVIFILNGPELNLLGIRARAYYGSGTLGDLKSLREAKARPMDDAVRWHRSVTLGGADAHWGEGDDHAG